MIPYGKQLIDINDISSVVETLNSTFLTQGSKVPEFEAAIKKIVNAQYAVASSSATAALHLACLAISLTSSDIGWTVPLTFAASANAMRYCGATVDFVDIDLATGCISTDALAEKLKIAHQNNKLPKVLIVVHYSGISCDMQLIKQLCQPYNIAIIEDASHAIGGSYQGNKIGCCQYSDMTIFSFHPVKIITSGEGGMITTNQQELADKLKLLGSHGITKDHQLMTNETAEPWYYEQQQLGFNYRMSDIHAALGLSQLNKLEAFVEKRNKQAQLYQQTFAELPIELLQVPEDCYSPWHLFVIRLKKEASITRLELYQALQSANIGCQVHYIPVHTHPYYQSLGFNWGDFPNAEQFYQQCLSLPIFPDLAKQPKVIENITSLLQTKG